MKAWHFSTGKLGYGDNREIKEGITHTVDCKPTLCQCGLHASIKPIDALIYAPGPIVSYVELCGDIAQGKDKVAALSRTYIAVANADNVLREFARWCALQVVHLWDCPIDVIEYLQTGDKDLRDAAMNIAWNATRAAAWDSAARVAAWNATRAIAWDAARATSWDAARAVATDAAWNAAHEDAAWDAAMKATREKQNKKLEEMLFELINIVDL